MKLNWIDHLPRPERSGVKGAIMQVWLLFSLLCAPYVGIDWPRWFDLPRTQVVRRDYLVTHISASARPPAFQFHSEQQQTPAQIDYDNPYIDGIEIHEQDGIVYDFVSDQTHTQWQFRVALDVRRPKEHICRMLELIKDENPDPVYALSCDGVVTAKESWTANRAASCIHAVLWATVGKSGTSETLVQDVATACGEKVR